MRNSPRSLPRKSGCAEYPLYLFTTQDNVANFSTKDLEQLGNRQ